jgi:hypothetical protein
MHVALQLRASRSPSPARTSGIAGVACAPETASFAPATDARFPFRLAGAHAASTPRATCASWATGATEASTASPAADIGLSLRPAFTYSSEAAWTPSLAWTARAAQATEVASTAGVSARRGGIGAP